MAQGFAADTAQRDHHRRLPWDELDDWSRSGLGGITVPRGFGGAQVSHETLARLFVILCAADPALGQIPQNHDALVAVLREVGTSPQQARLYAEALAGRRLGNAGPERGGADRATLLASAASLVDDGQGLRLHGRRFYSTGALFAHRIPPARSTRKAARCRPGCRSTRPACG